MTQSKRKSRDEGAGEGPPNDGGGGLNGVVTDSEVVGKSAPEREEIAEKVERKKKNEKKEKGEEEVKAKGSGGEQGEDGGVNKKKKKRKWAEDDMVGLQGKGIGGKGAGGGKMKGREEVMTKKDESGKKSKEYRGSENGGDDGPRAIVSSSEVRRVEADDEARKPSKKQREGKKKGCKKDDKKAGEGSVSMKKRKLRDGDENADEKLKSACKSNGSVSQSDPSLVLPLSRSVQKSRIESPNKKNSVKAEENRKKPSEKRSERKKRKSGDGETRGLSVPTSGWEEEPEEGTKKSEKDNGEGLKKKKTSREKANEKGPKSCSLPLNRVRTIMRSDNSNSKVTQECYFLICKAAVYNSPMLG